MLCEAGELDDAWELCNQGLTDNPEQPGFLLVASQLHDKTKRLPIAYLFAKRVTEIAPHVAEGWLNLGRINDELYRFTEAHTCYQKSLETCKRKELRCLILTNLSGVCVTEARWPDAERYARLALSIDPTNRKAQANLGTSCLAQKKWKEGWAGYGAVLGMDSRKLVQFAGEPVWDGSPGKSIIIYGEQGLGDEICFASMFGDAIRDSRKVVIECDAKLEGLFRRSFPACKVYGTRWSKEVLWDEEDRSPEASVSSGALGAMYRTTTESFPGTPYLQADPERMAMWQAAWNLKKKPVIGIAWTGGVQWTGEKFRRITLDQFLPAFKALDATWVSLQYKDAALEIAEFKVAHPEIDLRQYPATLSKDYDDTAAMVATMDLVIAPPTSVVNLAGGLGTECIAMHGPYDCWKFAQGMPWHQTNITFAAHHGTWGRTIESIIPMIKDRIC